MSSRVREEYEWQSVQGYLTERVTVAFVGPHNDQRSQVFRQEWEQRGCLLVELESPVHSDINSEAEFSVQITTSRNGGQKEDMPLRPLVTGLRAFLAERATDLEVVCVDITSLQHMVLMYLTKLLITECKPKQLFATYAHPKDYARKGDGDFDLSTSYLEGQPVPGFARRIRRDEVRLVAFLGFEGERLEQVKKHIDQVTEVYPVIGFPSFYPGWHARSLRACMHVLSKNDAEIQKCAADSIIEAYDLAHMLQPRTSDGPALALAPLGTRPHSMACALYAAKHPETLIVYDHPIEVRRDRSYGVTDRIVYHLSSFLDDAEYSGLS